MSGRARFLPEVGRGGMFRSRPLSSTRKTPSPPRQPATGLWQHSDPAPAAAPDGDHPQRGAILMEHPDRHQCCGVFQPGHRQWAAICHFQEPVLITAFKDQRGVFDVSAPDIKVQHRIGEARGAFGNLTCKFHRDPFAARHAVQVSRRQTDRADFRVGGEPVFHRHHRLPSKGWRRGAGLWRPAALWSMPLVPISDQTKRQLWTPV